MPSPPFPTSCRIRRKFPYPPAFDEAVKGMKFPTTAEHPLRLPRKGGFNDDVKLEAYQPASLSFAGKQRKCIREAFGGCSSFTDHVGRAMKHPFPLASEIPIPADTARLNL